MVVDKLWNVRIDKKSIIKFYFFCPFILQNMLGFILSFSINKLDAGSNVYIFQPFQTNVPSAKSEQRDSQME